MRVTFAFIPLFVLAALVPERSMAVSPQVLPQEGGQTGEVTADAAKPEELSFRVRQGVVGSGFDSGTTGWLRVSDLGLEFLKTRTHRPLWSIRWVEFAAARKDGGIWDLPFPLVLVDRGGAKLYIALLDELGRCIPGDPLLAAISKRHPKGKAAVQDQVRDPGGQT